MPNYVFQKNIPADWTFAELKINDEKVDRIEFIRGKKISKTLDNELIQAEYISNLKMSKETDSEYPVDTRDKARRRPRFFRPTSTDCPEATCTSHIQL